MFDIPEYNSFLEVAARQIANEQKVPEYLIHKVFGKKPSIPDSPDLDTQADAYQEIVEYSKKVDTFMEEATLLSKKYKK